MICYYQKRRTDIDETKSGEWYGEYGIEMAIMGHIIWSYPFLRSNWSLLIDSKVNQSIIFLFCPSLFRWLLVITRRDLVGESNFLETHPKYLKSLGPCLGSSRPKHKISHIGFTQPRTDYLSNLLKMNSLIFLMILTLLQWQWFVPLVPFSGC